MTLYIKLSQKSCQSIIWVRLKTSSGGATLAWEKGPRCEIIAQFPASLQSRSQSLRRAHYCLHPVFSAGLALNSVSEVKTQ